MEKNSKNGFTLLEVLTVVIIIFILAVLGWSNMSELIQTNKAKEAARTMTAFAERAIAEGKTRKESVTITISGNSIIAEDEDGGELARETLADGFTATPAILVSQPRIGISGIDEGNFEACNPSGYCGRAVKTASRNSFAAYFKRKNSSSWEAL